MGLEEFLKTFLGIDKFEAQEDGSVVVSMLVKDQKREQYIDTVLAPKSSASNIATLDRMVDARLELLTDWAEQDAHELEEEFETDQEYRDVD
jgi:hypothetical protein